MEYFTGFFWFKLAIGLLLVMMWTGIIGNFEKDWVWPVFKLFGMAIFSCITLAFLTT